MGDDQSGQTSATTSDGGGSSAVTSPPAQPQVIHVSPAPVYYPAPLGQFPQTMQCPQCHRHVVTSVQLINGTFTWLMMIVLIIIALPFFWLPLVMDCAKDAIHHCPNCGHFFGQFNKLKGGS